MAENTIGRFALGTIKTFKGHEGERCMQGTITLDGRKVAEWSEDAWGGPHRFTFADRTLEKEFHQAANEHPVARNFVEEMRQKYPDVKSEGHSDLVVSTVAGEMLQEKEATAQLRRWCKTMFVYRTPDMEEGTYYQLKFPKGVTYDPKKDDAQILAKVPNAEIINKRFVDDPR